MISLALFFTLLCASAQGQAHVPLATAETFLRVMAEKPLVHEELLVGQQSRVDELFRDGFIPVGTAATIPVNKKTAASGFSLNSALSSEPQDLNIPAASAIALDRDSDAVLFEKNKDKRAAIGSTTKMMTAIVVLESGALLNEVVNVSDEAAHTEGSTMGTKPGDQLSLKDMLYGLLIPSGNDAAVALAQHVSRGRTDQFVDLMNEKARVLGLHNTRFANPTGLDQEGNYSSVYDLAQLMDYALDNPFFIDAFSLKEYTAYVLNKPETRVFTATDKLVGTRPDIIGGKTGFTYQAGYCFIGVSQRDGHKLITVVLNAKDRFKETEQIVDWIFEQYQWGI